jgi:hypothetical protein
MTKKEILLNALDENWITEDIWLEIIKLVSATDQVFDEVHSFHGRYYLPDEQVTRLKIIIKLALRDIEVLCGRCKKQYSPETGYRFSITDVACEACLDEFLAWQKKKDIDVTKINKTKNTKTILDAAFDRGWTNIVNEVNNDAETKKEMLMSMLSKNRYLL